MKKCSILLLAVITCFVGRELLFAASPTTRPTEFAVFPVSAPFKLSEAKGKFVALHFLLKTECPFCLRYTHEFATQAKAQPDVVHVFLKPDSEEAIAKWMGKLDGDSSTHPTIYRDADAKLAKAYGIPSGYKFHNEVVHYPALIILDPNGVEAFRYIGKSNADRMSFDDFSRKLAELKKP